MKVIKVAALSSMACGMVCPYCHQHHANPFAHHAGFTLQKELSPDEDLEPVLANKLVTPPSEPQRKQLVESDDIIQTQTALNQLLHSPSSEADSERQMSELSELIQEGQHKLAALTRRENELIGNLKVYQDLLSQLEE